MAVGVSPLAIMDGPTSPQPVVEHFWIEPGKSPDVQ
jgi:hypothetical protein